MDYKYEPHILALLEFDGFLNQFYIYCSEFNTAEQAYDAVCNNQLPLQVVVIFQKGILSYW